MCDLSFSAECESVAHGEAKPVMFMATVTAPPLSQLQLGSRATTAMSSGHAASIAPPSAILALSVSRGEPAAARSQALDVCCLEGCGLGWRVRPPLHRRGPWEVVAQRMKLCVEAVGGAKIEKLYTLLDHHELAPRSSYEVCVGDLWWQVNTSASAHRFSQLNQTLPEQRADISRGASRKSHHQHARAL